MSLISPLRYFITAADSSLQSPVVASTEHISCALPTLSLCCPRSCSCYLWQPSSPSNQAPSLYAVRTSPDAMSSHFVPLASQSFLAVSLSL